MNNKERQSVADYLREVAVMIEQGAAHRFDFRWKPGRMALSNLEVLPVTNEHRTDLEERKGVERPHVAEVCLSIDRLVPTGI